MEVLLHITVYAGIPAGVVTVRTAKEYFDEASRGVATVEVSRDQKRNEYGGPAWTDPPYVIPAA